MDYKNNNYFSNYQMHDYGNTPFVTDLKQATLVNNNFRTALWSGSHLQLTLMSIPPNSDIGLEVHPHVDQLLYIESGNGFVQMGIRENSLNCQYQVSENCAIFVPAGTWHNLINIGRSPIKLFSVYAPPQHPKGTVHHTKADAEASERY